MVLPKTFAVVNPILLPDAVVTKYDRIALGGAYGTN